MKLRKNDYQELRKNGVGAITAKLTELADDYAKTMTQKMKNELKNPRAGAPTRRAIAVLKTIRSEIEEVQ